MHLCCLQPFRFPTEKKNWAWLFFGDNIKSGKFWSLKTIYLNIRQIKTLTEKVKFLRYLLLILATPIEVSLFFRPSHIAWFPINQWPIMNDATVLNCSLAKWNIQYFLSLIIRFDLNLKSVNIISHFFVNKWQKLWF